MSSRLDVHAPLPLVLMAARFEHQEVARPHVVPVNFFLVDIFKGLTPFWPAPPNRRSVVLGDLQPFKQGPSANDIPLLVEAAVQM